MLSRIALALKSMARQGWPRRLPKDERKNKMKSKGLGDTVEKITTITGIKRIVDKVAEKTGKDCGCTARKNALNKMIPYGK
jgi:hypothetical protein